MALAQKIGRLARVLLLLCLFCAGAFALLTQVAGALADATERDVTYRYFDDALPEAPRSGNLVRWLPPSAPLDRVFGPSEQDLVGTTLSEAWAGHAVSMETEIPLGLEDHFTGVALDRATRSVATSGLRMVVLTQSARPVFFQADGSLLQVETDALIARFQLGETGELLQFNLSRDTTLTTLINERFGWRILSHERRGSQPVASAADGRPVPSRLAGINYYPATTPWTGFWSGFDARIIARDFAQITDIGANAVRIFLHRETFLDPTTAPRALSDLAALLDIAEAQGLSVIPTLFDLRGGYGAVGWANDADWVARVLPVLAASSAVAYVDLKNEPDLDMEHDDPGQVEAWARAMLGVARTIAPDLPYTIGWSTPEAAGILADTLDIISYHDYGAVASSADALNRVRALAGERPVHVTEIGETSYSLLAGIFPASPDLQADRLSRRLQALATADGIFVWTLHDFDNPDPAAIGLSPWVRRLQSRFGLLALDGTRKPAADVVDLEFDAFLSSQP